MDSKQLYAEYQALAGRRDPAALQRRSELVPMIAQARQAERNGMRAAPMQPPSPMGPPPAPIRQPQRFPNQAPAQPPMGERPMQPPRPIAGPGMPAGPVQVFPTMPKGGLSPESAGTMPRSGGYQPMPPIDLGQLFGRRR